MRALPLEMKGIATMTTDNLREGGHAGPSFSRRTFAKAAGVSAAALAIGASGASLAWFTGRDVKENKLSIAQNLNIRVVEPAWDPENAKSAVPNQHIPKDPRIENLSDEFSGWMVVEIRVPTAVVSVFDETEQKVLDPARTPLFSFVADPQWTLLQQFEDGDDDVYRFGWPETIPALGQTPPIFEEVVVANLVEAQGQSGSKIITATGYGIQSEGLPDIATAWDAYKKQNGIGDGEPNKRIVSAVTAGTLLKFVEGVPEVGDKVDGRTIGEVVPDIEHLPAQDTTPLTSTPETITYVDGATPTAPEDTVNWFKNMSKVEEIDISGMDTTNAKNSQGMFEGASRLERIRIGENTNVENAAAEAGLEFIKLSDESNLLHVLQFTYEGVNNTEVNDCIGSIKIRNSSSELYAAVITDIEVKHGENSIVYEIDNATGWLESSDWANEYPLPSGNLVTRNVAYLPQTKGSQANLPIDISYAKTVTSTGGINYERYSDESITELKLDITFFDSMGVERFKKTITVRLTKSQYESGRYEIIPDTLQLYGSSKSYGYSFEPILAVSEYLNIERTSIVSTMRITPDVVNPESYECECYYVAKTGETKNSTFLLSAMRKQLNARESLKYKFFSDMTDQGEAGIHIKNETGASDYWPLITVSASRTGEVKIPWCSNYLPGNWFGFSVRWGQYSW